MLGIFILVVVVLSAITFSAAGNETSDFDCWVFIKDAFVTVAGTVLLSFTYWK